MVLQIVYNVMSHVKLVLVLQLISAQAVIQPVLIVTIIASLVRVHARMGSISRAMRFARYVITLV